MSKLKDLNFFEKKRYRQKKTREEFDFLNNMLNVVSISQEHTLYFCFSRRLIWLAGPPFCGSHGGGLLAPPFSLFSSSSPFLSLFHFFSQLSSRCHLPFPFFFFFFLHFFPQLFFFKFQFLEFCGGDKTRAEVMAAKVSCFNFFDSQTKFKKSSKKYCLKKEKRD